jgi:hypothetical protein
MPLPTRAGGRSCGWFATGRARSMRSPGSSTSPSRHFPAPEGAQGRGPGGRATAGPAATVPRAARRARRAGTSTVEVQLTADSGAPAWNSATATCRRASGPGMSAAGPITSPGSALPPLAATPAPIQACPRHLKKTQHNDRRYRRHRGDLEWPGLGDCGASVGTDVVRSAGPFSTTLRDNADLRASAADREQRWVTDDGVSRTGSGGRQCPGQAKRRGLLGQR